MVRQSSPEFVLCSAVTRRLALILAALPVGYLVHFVNASEDSRLNVVRQLDAKRERNSELVKEVLRRENALEQTQLELQLGRQNKFSTRWLHPIGW